MAEHAVYGCVILESLTSTDVVGGLVPVARRVVNVPEDPDATTWHVLWYLIDRQTLDALLPRLAAAVRPNWYAHFWEGDDLCVILPGRVFRAKASDRATWQDFIAYGETVGVERRWTENIPTRLPEWVRETLSSWHTTGTG